MVEVCGAPKKVGRLTCEVCTCAGEQDVQKVTKNTLRAIKFLELMQEGGVKVVKIEPLLELLKRK